MAAFAGGVEGGDERELLDGRYLVAVPGAPVEPCGVRRACGGCEDAVGEVVLSPLDRAVLEVDERVALDEVAVGVEAQSVEVGGEVEAVVVWRRGVSGARILDAAVRPLVDERKPLVLRELRADASERRGHLGVVVLPHAVRALVRKSCVGVEGTVLHSGGDRRKERVEASVREAQLALVAVLAAAARLDVDRPEGAGVASGGRVLRDLHGVREVDRDGVHERVSPDARLPRDAVGVHPDLAAGTCRALSADVDASALRAAVAADGGVS